MSNKDEYNAFGPWIYEINSEHPVPAMYKEFVDVKQKHELLIKIPVEKERRDLKPDMQLYKCVIGLYGDHLSIIRGEESMVTTETVNYKDIVAVENSVTLLLGVFILYGVGKQYTVTYNASSQKIIDKLIGIVRSKITRKDTEMKVRSDNEKDVKLSFYYDNELSRVKREEKGAKLISYQQELRVNSIRLNFFAGLWEKILNPRLLESMCLKTGKELLILNSSEYFKMRFHPNYGNTRIFLPLKYIRTAVIEKSEKYQDIVVVKFQVLSRSFSLYFQKDNNTLDSLMHELPYYDGVMH